MITNAISNQIALKITKAFAQTSLWRKYYQFWVQVHESKGLRRLSKCITR